MLKLVKPQDPILRNLTNDLGHFDDSFEKAALEMFDIMIENKGVGLAAPQVGLPYSFFITLPIMSTPNWRDNRFNLFINPQILCSEGVCTAEEGCLSLPNRIVQVSRPRIIVFEADDYLGHRYKSRLENYSARIFCHEYDHLLGKLIIDYY